MMRILLAAVLSMTMAVTTTAYGNSVYTLTDQNSVMEIDPLSMDGQFTWVVDDVNYLSKQWFWYRTGSDTQEYSIDTLNLTWAKTADLNPYPGDESMSLQYTKDNEFVNCLIEVQQD